MKRLMLFIVFLIFAPCLKAQEKQIVVPYTLADRDRAIRTEVKLETLIAKIAGVDGEVGGLDKRISSLETKMDNLKTQMNRFESKLDNYFMWGFGMVLMSIFGLIGFIVYDRRTTIAPVEDKTERIIKALKERAEKDPILMEALKNTALW